MPGLTVGGHGFAVAAVDSAGNVDHSPAFFTWTVTQAQQSQSPTNPDSSTTGTSSQSKQKTIVHAQITKKANQLSSLATTASCSADVCVNPGDTVSLSFECTNTDPNAIETCIMLNGPPGATFESSAGNPAEATMTWTNAGPPGTYEASFQATAVFCPPDDTCIESYTNCHNIR